MENLLKGLQGQHVLITGAAGGIGFSCAELFLSLGAKVSLHYNSQKKTLESLLLQYPENAFALSVDASSEDAIEAGVRQSVQKFGFINVAVINHAFYELKAAPIWEMSLKQWQKTLDIDLTSYFLYSREWARQLKSHAADLNQQALAELNASLILIGSTAGKHGEAAHSDYSVCKSALHNGFLLSVKNELVQLAPFARVNVVAPGWTETPMSVFSFLKSSPSVKRKDTGRKKPSPGEST